MSNGDIGRKTTLINIYIPFTGQRGTDRVGQNTNLVWIRCVKIGYKPETEKRIGGAMSTSKRKETK